MNSNQISKIRLLGIEYYDDICNVNYNEVSIVVGFGYQLTLDLLSGFPNLKWVHSYSSGIEHIPLNYLQKNDILLTNSKGIHSIPVAEYVISMMINLSRNNFSYYSNQRKRIWNDELVNSEIFGKKVTIVGNGSIGKRITKICHVLGLYVDTVSSHNKHDLNKLLIDRDFIIICLPLTNSTKNLFDERRLALLSSNTVIINISRGDIVDEDCLFNSLKEKRIKAAILDVFREEPLPKENPLWELDNVFLTPHVSGKTDMYFQRAFKLFFDNLSCYKNNSFLENIVDFDKKY